MAADTKRRKADSGADSDDGLNFSENEVKVSKTLDDKKGKKEKKEKKPKREAAERRSIGGILAVFIGLLLVAGVSALLFFNIFSLRTRYVMPLLQRVPIVNNLVRQDEASGGPYANATHDELVAQIESLTAQNAQLAADNLALEDRNKLFTDEITRLQEFEAGQLSFREDKEAFDRMIAMNDPAAYSSFYESISPENAETLAIEATASVQRDKDFRKYINTVQSVDATEAARILDELIRTDIDLVVLILNNLDSETSGEILASMTTRNAATAVRRMAPAQE